jgi:hypothetical protein
LCGEIGREERVIRTIASLDAVRPASKPSVNAKLEESIMKKFVRQKSVNAPIADITLDFGAAAAKVARVFEPGDYKLRIESARIVQSGQNVFVALDLVETEGGGRVASRPLWVDGPNAGVGPYAAENQDLLAQLLTLAGQPTAGNVSALIPKLTGLEFDGYLILKRDTNGRTYNTIAAIYHDGAP